MREIILTCKVWTAGTNTKVLGILKRDVEMHEVEDGEIWAIKVLQRNKDHAQLSEAGYTSPAKSEGEKFNSTTSSKLSPLFKRTGKTSDKDAGAPSTPKKDKKIWRVS